MKEADRTQLGGSKSDFPETEWTRISQVRADDEAGRDEALSVMCGRYWKPVYCYLLRKGRENEDAKDLTQAFFQEVLLGKDFVARADKAKGKFRTFLLTALDRFLISKHRAASAKKRAPDKPLVRLDQLESWQMPELGRGVTPEEAFTYTWASELLQQVLDSVKTKCRTAKQERHWEVFQKMIVEPLWSGEGPPKLADLCRDLQIADEAKASNMCITVKRKFQAALRQRIRQSVDSDDLVDQEIGEVMEILARIGAGA